MLIAMPRVVFTSHLQRHVQCADVAVKSLTVRAAMEEVFKLQPQVRGYIVDEQGHVRKHVFLFVDGQRLRESALPDMALGDASEIHVMQALTGG